MDGKSRRPALWAVALGVAATVSYLAFLGWDRNKDVDPVTGAETGPYEAWQVVGLGLVVAVLAFGAGRQHQVVPALVGIPAGLTLAFVVAAVTSPDADLWLVGAVLVALGSAAGTALVALIGRSTTKRSPA
jgi:peptidoglycan/LPS O-acetylase OafA/YrhL